MTTLYLLPSRLRSACSGSFSALPLILGFMISLSSPGLVQGADSDTEPAPAAESKPDQADLEKSFKDTLTQATFEGRWSLIKDGTLGPALDEKYTISGVSKVGGEVWLVYARIQYGKTDATVPIPVKVKWAGDTPVISITDLAIPGIGTYTARVVVHEGMYAGTWSGGNHGGVLSGIIRK